MSKCTPDACLLNKKEFHAHTRTCTHLPKNIFTVSSGPLCSPPSHFVSNMMQVPYDKAEATVLNTQTPFPLDDAYRSLLNRYLTRLFNFFSNGSLDSERPVEPGLPIHRVFVLCRKFNMLNTSFTPEDVYAILQELYDLPYGLFPVSFPLPPPWISTVSSPFCCGWYMWANRYRTCAFFAFPSGCFWNWC